MDDCSLDDDKFDDDFEMLCVDDFSVDDDKFDDDMLTFEMLCVTVMCLFKEESFGYSFLQPTKPHLNTLSNQS